MRTINFMFGGGIPTSPGMRQFDLTKLDTKIIRYREETERVTSSQTLVWFPLL